MLPLDPPTPAPLTPALPRCGVLSFDAGGALLSANRWVRDWTGRDTWPAPGDPGALHVADLLAPGAAARWTDALLPTLRRDGLLEDGQVLALRTAQGQERPALWQLGPATAAGTGAAAGPGLGVAPVHVAILLLLPADAPVPVRPPPAADARRAEAHPAATTADHLPGVVYQFLLRPDGSACLPYASRALVRLFGVTPEAARRSAQGLGEHVHRGDWALVEDSIKVSARTLARWDGAFRTVVDGEVRWLEGHATPEALPGGALLWHGYLCDVTERRAETAARHQQALADQAGRARSELLARLSHELRTPLNAVLGFAQLLSADGALSLQPHQKRQLDQIERAGRSLLVLINHVLELTHLEDGRVPLRIRSLDLQAVVDDALAMVDAMAARGAIALRAQVPPGIRVAADRDRLGQCLVNLLTHALRHNAAGGQVALVAYPPRHGVVRIDVRDTGNGFTPSELSALFEPFARPEGVAVGDEAEALGLLIVRTLAERMAGRLTVESEPGQGTVASLHLPATGEPSSDSTVRSTPGEIDVPPPAPAPASAGPRRVLYIEDNAVNVMLMQAIFALRPGFALDTASTAADGLARALAQPPALLLLDLGLPDTDGLTLLGQLKAEPTLAGVPAVAVSADAMTADIDRALAAGFIAYWTKPLDLRKTLQALDALMASVGGPG